MGRNIVELQKCLQILELMNGDMVREEIIEIWRALKGWLDTEAVMRNQQSRNMRLVDGDRNTSFFHAKASHRYQKNLILGLCNDDSVWQEDDRWFEDIVVKYFANIFKTSGPSDASTMLNTIQPVVTNAMNTSLVLELQATEVIKALKQMHPKKALGPNSVPPSFYQYFLL